MENDRYASGWPGIPARWTSSAKSGVGTSLSYASRVWFTLSHGILNEVYYPRLDQACTRDLGLIVTDGKGFFSEEKRHAGFTVTCPFEGVPAYKLTNTCTRGRYRTEKEIVSDPVREVVLQRVSFTPLQGKPSDYHLFVLLAPHLGNRGAGNTAWVGDYKGTEMIFAERDGNALALACSAPWIQRTVGFVGVSDGWQDLASTGSLSRLYTRAENGNVAMCGEVAIVAGAPFLLSLGFGRGPAEAGNRALASLLDGFDAARDEYVRQWQAWQKTLPFRDDKRTGGRDLLRISTAVLRTHESKNFPGGLIASLAVPWGFAKGDDDLGGYHLAWPRDLVESATGLLATGARKDVQRVLRYIRAAQDADGHWPQNMWLDGTPYWYGIQMDETAFPILLADIAQREGAITEDEGRTLWPMVRRAAGFLLRNGPVTQQDRWEEDAGYSPFTLAVEIAALLAAADMADLCGEHAPAEYLRETADAWNAHIERWVYVTGTDIARKVGVDGYYVRITPPDVADAASPASGFVPIKNRPPGSSSEPADHIVSPDALALVRFGLRGPADPRIVNTVKVIDAILKVETPRGPAWRRYNDDGYGEHEDGSPFDGTGVGRAWPLLTGERAHYELAAGRREEAERLLATLESFANEGGLISEQIWESADIPSRELYFGRPSGSAMPLVWAHAEYLKLRRSLSDGRVFDTPPQPLQRYVVAKTESPHCVWKFNHKVRSMPPGKVLRIETLSAGIVHGSLDDWVTSLDVETGDTGMGVFFVDLPTEKMREGESVKFTFFWSQAGNWEGRDFEVTVKADADVSGISSPVRRSSL
jgi:glucoamylase